MSIFGCVTQCDLSDDKNVYFGLKRSVNFFQTDPKSDFKSHTCLLKSD